MRLTVRSAAVALLTLVAAVLLAVSTTWTSVVLAATALIMGGTGHPLSVSQDSSQFIKNYVNGANDSYIDNSGLCSGGNPGPCTLVAVVTPEQFRFDTGLTDMTFDDSVAAGRQNLDKCIRAGSCVVTPPPDYNTTGNQSVSDTSYVVYGYSQSATVATVEKRYLIDNPPPANTDVSFILVANPNRPNGGILERFNGLYIPILGVTFNGATPTDTDMTTVDAARQYDIISDFPTNPLNLFSDINAGFGFFYLHGTSTGLGTPLLQGQYGDTTYYLFPTPVLPLLMPLDRVPLIGHPLAVTLDPFFRVLVEAGYNRTINPGQPTTAQLLYFPNPINTAVNLVIAVPTGLDNGISVISGNPANRPFGTLPPGPYGVGGPPVDAGCAGGADCNNPTPYVAVNQAQEFADAKQAPQPPPPAPDPKPNNDGQTALDTSTPKILPFNLKPTDTQGSTPGTNKPTPPGIRKPIAPKLPVVNKVVQTIQGVFKHSPADPAAGDENPDADAPKIFERGHQVAS